MIILDANILLYAYDSMSVLHEKSRKWLESTFSSASSVGIPWQTVTAFLRVSTNTRLPGQRFTIPEAADIVEQWRLQPNVQFLAPGEAHWRLLQEMMLEGQAQGPLVTDAHLAALTLEYAGTLHTTDRDFARFPRLRWINPLAS